MDKLIEWYSNPINIKRLSTWLRKYVRVNGLFKTQDDVNFTIEDVIQKAFLNLYRKGPDYIREHTIYASIDTLIFTVAINNATSEIRTRKRQKTFSLEDLEKSNDDESGLFVNIKNSRYYLDPNSSPDRDAENNELREILNKGLGELPKKYKSSFLLWMTQEYTYNQMSDILGKPVGTVKSSVYRAKEILKADMCIKKHYEALKL